MWEKINAGVNVCMIPWYNTKMDWLTDWQTDWFTGYVHGRHFMSDKCAPSVPCLSFYLPTGCSSCSETISMCINSLLSNILDTTIKGLVLLQRYQWTQLFVVSVLFIDLHFYTDYSSLRCISLNCYIRVTAVLGGDCYISLNCCRVKLHCILQYLKPDGVGHVSSVILWSQRKG